MRALILGLLIVAACGENPTAPRAQDRFCVDDARVEFEQMVELAPGDTGRLTYLAGSATTHPPLCIELRPTGTDSGTYTISGRWVGSFRRSQGGLSDTLQLAFTFPHQGIWRAHGDTLAFLTGDCCGWFGMAYHTNPAANGGFTTFWLWEEPGYREWLVVPWVRT